MDIDAETQEILDNIQQQLERRLGIVEDGEKTILKDTLEDALSDVLDYCNQDKLKGNMHASVKDLCIIRWNQEGNEGETSRSEGGVSQSFETGIPAKIKSKLNRYRVANVKKIGGT